MRREGGVRVQGEHQRTGREVQAGVPGIGATKPALVDDQQSLVVAGGEHRANVLGRRITTRAWIGRLQIEALAERVERGARGAIEHGDDLEIRIALADQTFDRARGRGGVGADQQNRRDAGQRAGAGRRLAKQRAREAPLSAKLDRRAGQPRELAQVIDHERARHRHDDDQPDHRPALGVRPDVA